MRTSVLLVIGIIFLGLALAGAIYLVLLAGPEERNSTTENIPGGTLGPITAIPIDITRPPSTRTSTPIPSATGTPLPSATPTTTPSTGIATPRISYCDKAELVGDVTVPNGTIFAPGAIFTKTWRLKNVGHCKWSTSYQLVYFSGAQLGVPASILLPREVPPGQTLDISLNMTAPSATGAYRSYWMFKNSHGKLFGVGPKADQPWWVEIEVSGPTVTAGGPTITPGAPTVTPLPPQPTLVPIDVPPQLVEVEWPTRLRVGQSGTIRVSLIKGSQGYEATVEIQGNTAVVSTPISVGTPEVEPSRAYGPNYEAFAVAHIAGTAFEVSLASPESQSLDQSRVDWVWNITSDDPGLQGMDVSIEMEWRPIDNHGEPLTRQIWRSHLQIDVFKPIFSAGQVSAFSLLTGFLGSGLSIPWLYETISKRRAQRRRKGSKRA